MARPLREPGHPSFGMEQAGAQLMTWFGVACELHRDWRNDIEGLGALFSNHIHHYHNLSTSHDTLTKAG